MNEKILSSERMEEISANFRADKRALVFTNGCFDLLHVGHVRYLQTARALGDALVVAINGDSSVRELKGAGRPLTPEKERAEIVAALACVDYVVVFPQVRATQLLEKLRPAIYVKGGDYTPETLDSEERAALGKIGAGIKILPFAQGRSTSALIEKIKQITPR